LSEERVEDTLLAEAGEAIELIEIFRNQRSEHNRESLSALLGVKNGDLEDAIRRLRDIGFLEETGQTFKVPMLYREGLQIVQGKAFAG
jgi:Fic family protein